MLTDPRNFFGGLGLSHEPSDPKIEKFLDSSPARAGFWQLDLDCHWAIKISDRSDLQAIARFGETIVAGLALGCGWNVMFERKRHRGFELDLVLRRQDEIRIVEIKTRLCPLMPPDMHVVAGWLNQKKQRAMRRGARHLLGEFHSNLVSFRTISGELVAIDLLPENRALAYRWPDAFSLE